MPERVSQPAAPLLLLVHGRSGGDIPRELRRLAADLQDQRRSPVQLLALTDPAPAVLPASDRGGQATILVPLLLLPGGHVRRDLPALTQQLRRQGRLRRLPFLGSWPLWQRALARELDASAHPGEEGGQPLLLHHPLEGRLAHRYLTLLACRCQALCRPAAFADLASWDVLESLRGDRSVLPLALAANRLTDSLRQFCPEAVARPLLERPRLRQSLLEALIAVS
ncbi:MAG: CbiX/SirB N-terminal domain-containing protein [Cyanobium sp.]